MRTARSIGCKHYKVVVDERSDEVQVHEVRWKNEMHDAVRAQSVEMWHKP